MLPISSYAIVLYAALPHLIQALILLGSRTADGSIGLHSLLAVIPDRRGLAAALIASSSACLRGAVEKVSSALAYRNSTHPAASSPVHHRDRGMACGMARQLRRRGCALVCIHHRRPIASWHVSLVHLTAMFTLGMVSRCAARR